MTKRRPGNQQSARHIKHRPVREKAEAGLTEESGKIPDETKTG